MFRLTLIKVAAVGTAAAAAVGAGAVTIAHVGNASAATAAAQSSPAVPAPSPSVPLVRGKSILGRALHHRLVKATAEATGQTPTQVRAELRSGKSLAQIAGDKVAAVEKTVTDATKARLDKAVAHGRITADQERDLLGKLQAAIDKEMAATHTKIAAPAATPSA